MLPSDEIIAMLDPFFFFSIGEGHVNVYLDSVSGLCMDVHILLDFVFHPQ